MVDFKLSAPANVKKAVNILCLVLGFAVLIGLIEYWQKSTEVTAVGDTTLAVMNLFIGLLALGANIVFLRLRMNWSRYLLALMFIFGLPSLLGSMAKAFQSAFLFLGLLNLIQLAGEAYILFLLFTPPAREWYEAE